MKGTEYQPQSNGTSATMDDAGAQDNLLSLDPNNPAWRDEVGNWEDDKQYVFKEVRVRQISPGQFEVLSATPAESSEKDTAEGGENNEGDTPDKGMDGMTDNPAVNSMMMR